ncbi:glycosyltransferase [Lichenibacterium ramalinae]|uniref:Glycosyltransferase family 1 protein n=1 Tax=Lichenibacterium ramalinae TaxID=2316527 RepID=A0A4Q2REH8_9HYPH|nr:glycosyltransferase [Lichenibacterium ramalinae]RYB05025.1 glycosyltransferase family 1 protein [Lichenibacterium ramalinae]
MAHQRGLDHAPLRVMHVLRAPLGGLYRHVLDLSREQARRGHAVGLIVDANTGGDYADRTLRDLAPSLALGLSRVPMHRNPNPSDAAALMHVLRRLRDAGPDVVHGHGSKGGVFARLPGLLPGGGRSVRAYTPHGGSVNHRPGTHVHRLYMAVERLLGRSTDLLLFESAFIGARYRAVVGEPSALVRVVHNGIADDEFEPVVAAPDAADFLYVGELRAAKGIDVLLNAIQAVGRRSGTTPRAVLVGSGPDRDALERLVVDLGLSGRVTLTGPLPARQAFTLGRTLVVPSRAESLPYVVLEAAAARLPLISTDVGGIPEIFGPYRSRLIPPDDVERLVAAMTAALAAAPARRAKEAAELAAFVHDGFSITAMVDTVVSAYRDALAARDRPTVGRHSEIALSP